MKEHFDGQPALIMDFALPDKKMGVHTYDILTMTRPDGRVQICYTVIWTDCGENDTSHLCNGGYGIDVATEKIVGGLPHYTYHFSQEKNLNTKLYGRHCPKL